LGVVQRIPASDLHLSYRHNGAAKDLIFTQAYFVINKTATKTEIAAKIGELKQKREAAQPQGVRSCGSAFKNPPTPPSAGKLIEDAGFKGVNHLGAVMSLKHANFLVNENASSALALEELGEMVRKKVYDDTGIMLEWEIKIIGEKA